MNTAEKDLDVLTQPQRDSLWERALNKIEESDPPGDRPDCFGPCWVWTGAVARSRNEYPVITISLVLRKQTVLNTRRLLYFLSGRQPGMGEGEIKSTCGNSLCVAPHHLVPHSQSRGGRPLKIRKRRRV